MIPQSERLGHPQLSTPPPTPEKWRQLLRESEETSGEMTLETYLYNSDAYRCSSFESPWPLPLILELPSADFRMKGETMSSLLPTIRSIFEKHSLVESVVDVKAALVSKLDYVGGEIRTLTLLVYMDQVIPLTSSWAKARDDLQALVNESGFPQMRVEIFDEKRAFMPWLLPLRPDDNAVQPYEAKREHLLSVVKKSLESDWIAMSLFKLGSRSDPAKAALVVLIRPGAVQDWAEISSRLKKIWPDPNIPIEFLPGILGPRAGISLDPKLTSCHQIGSSIAERGEKGSGTLGGYVIWEKDGKKRFGVLTSHHVVRPFTAGDDTKEALDQHGYGSTHPNFTTLMQYPSLEDHEIGQKRIERTIENVEREIEEVQAVLQSFKRKGAPAPGLWVNRLHDYKESLVHFKERKEMISKLPMILGRALYSSGQAISSQNTILDWAFVELHDTKKKHFQTD